MSVENRKRMYEEILLHGKFMPDRLRKEFEIIKSKVVKKVKKIGK